MLGVMDSVARAISKQRTIFHLENVQAEVADTMVVLTVKRMLVSVVKSPLRSSGKVRLTLRRILRPFFGQVEIKGLVGSLALLVVSDDGVEKASCKVRIPLLPSD